MYEISFGVERRQLTSSGFEARLAGAIDTP
jgi:hypothetical protein